ncbi:MAG: integrase arm-type DNA-binding domain-containing protein [Gammaproteobacteria bacterium]|jgi:integrase|nr:integrase arm-type DNA-binding domain-containing protein [Gammaproteobacteria bacterium]
MRHIHNKLSDRSIKAAMCSEGKQSHDLRDGGGLILRVTPTGRKSWRYEYRSNNKKKALPLGAYPTLSLANARKLAIDAAHLRKTGIDPVERAKLNKAEAEVQQLQDAAAIEQEINEPLFQDLLNEYLFTLRGRPSHDEVKYSLEHDIPTSWLNRQAKSITLRECVLLLDKVKQRAPVRSNRLYAYLKRMFKVGTSRGLIETNPTTDVPKPAPEADHHDNRHKALSTDQLNTVITSLQSKSFDDVIRLMLLTGARPKEILHMKWSQMEEDIWTLGPGEHKAGYRKPRTIQRPLIPAAIEIIEKYRGHHDDLVFPGPKGTPMATTSLGHFVARQRNHFGIEGFTSHHVRHTMATRMREIGIAPHIAERILGHVVDTGIAGVYSSYDWLPEMRSALEIWERWIDQL